jgi:hypothetical protein
MMARVGAMIAPKINDLVINTFFVNFYLLYYNRDFLFLKSDISKSLPFLIFGISGLIGSITAVVLPETLGRILPENISQANKANKYGYNIKEILLFQFVQADVIN